MPTQGKITSRSKNLQKLMGTHLHSLPVTEKIIGNFAKVSSYNQLPIITCNQVDDISGPE